MRAASLALAAMLLPGLGRAASPAIELPGASGNQQTVVTPATGTRTGLDIYRRFRDGLAEGQVGAQKKL